MGLVPLHLDVVPPVSDEHDIDRSGAHNLIRERQVAALRVPSLRYVHQPRTTYSCQSPGMPLSEWVPRSSNSRPEPATRSTTVRETRTSPAPAWLQTRDAR